MIPHMRLPLNSVQLLIRIPKAVIVWYPTVRQRRVRSSFFDFVCQDIGSLERGKPDNILGCCQLMQAAFVRFHYIGYHDLFYPALDVLIVAGMLRDLVVDGRVNGVYLYVFPAMIVLQAWATYLERVNPSWWQAATQAILGL